MSHKLTGHTAFVEVLGQLTDHAGDLRMMTADRDRLLNDFAILQEQFAARGTEIADISIARDEAIIERDAEITRWRCICDRAERADAENRRLIAENSVLQARCAMVEGRRDFLEKQLKHHTAGEAPLEVLYQVADRSRMALHRYGHAVPLKRDDAKALAEELAKAQRDAFDWCNQIPF